jgi:hypothetical protein
MPVTVIFSPLRTAGPTCPPRTGARSTTLPFWRYRLRTSPLGPTLKARTREDWVTTGSFEVGAGAVTPLCGTAGCAGGSGAGVCAKATELNTTPRAVICREDRVCIGNTSARSKASRMPFLGTAEVAQSLHIGRVGYSQSILTRPQFAHLLCGLRTDR